MIHFYVVCVSIFDKLVIGITETSNYNSASLCRGRGFVDRGWTVQFDFQENRSHDSLQTRPMCCPEPEDVPFIFECVRMLSTYRIK